MPHLPRPRTLAVLAAVTISGLFGGCSTVSSTLSNTMTAGITRVITPYKIEIVQGNVVTREQLALVKPGTSRNDVREILGSPLVADPFHEARWDYVFTLKRGGTETMSRQLVVWFDGDTVRQVDAPELPSERDFVASIASPVQGKDRRLTLNDDERAALPPPKPVAAAPAGPGPQGANRTYPPVESL